MNMYKNRKILLFFFAKDAAVLKTPLVLEVYFINVPVLLKSATKFGKSDLRS